MNENEEVFNMVMSNRFTKILTMFLAVFMLCSMFAPSVFASVATVSFTTDALPETAIKEAIKAATEAMDSQVVAGQENKLFVKYKGVTYHVATYEKDSTGNGARFILEDSWTKLNSKTQTSTLKHFMDVLIDKDTVDDKALNTFMNDLQQQDRSVATAMLPILYESVVPDLYQAYIIAKPFLDVLNIILGVGCVLLILMLIFSTVMDLAYIGLPMWRESTANKNGSKTPFGVSYEAVSTVKEIESNTGGDYKNGYVLYLKHRGLTYIVLALCIVYLICGGLSGIISFVLSLVSGFSV